jgi:hypothetical protein
MPLEVSGGDELDVLELKFTPDDEADRAADARRHVQGENA